MVDEIYDRTYQAGRDQLNARLDAALDSIRCSVVKTFRAIEAVQFQAPWRRNRRDIGCA